MQLPPYKLSQQVRVIGPKADGSLARCSLVWVVKKLNFLKVKLLHFLLVKVKLLTWLLLKINK